ENPNVALRALRGTATAAADSAGRYRFTALSAGRHTLMAAAEGYSPTEVGYTYPDTSERYEKTIELDAAGVRRVLVRDASGNPVRDAAVMNFVGTTLAGERFTDETGRVAIPVRAGE